MPSIREQTTTKNRFRFEHGEEAPKTTQREITQEGLWSAHAKDTTGPMRRIH